jgi:hypothetical protein
MFCPQHEVVPFVWRAQVCSSPSARAVTPVRGAPSGETTGLGVGCCNAEVPAPSSPKWFDPQHSTLPPSTSAHECENPRPRACTPASGAPPGDFRTGAAFA